MIHPSPPTTDPPRLSAAAGLLIAPVVVLGVAWLVPRWSIPPAAADLFVFAGGVAASIGVLAVTAPVRLRLAPSLVLLAGAGAALVLTRWSGGSLRVALLDLALLATAYIIGGGVGWRIQHPGHLLPACIIAAAADVVSVVHPSGPSHAIAQSETALALLAFHFPVPGTSAAAPVLGIGDLVFSGLLFAAARAHRLGKARIACAIIAGALVAGGLAAVLGTPVPALVTIAAAVPVLVPAARRLRPEDRRTTAVATTVAIGLVVGVLAQRL